MGVSAEVQRKMYFCAITSLPKSVFIRENIAISQLPGEKRLQQMTSSRSQRHPVIPAQTQYQSQINERAETGKFFAAEAPEIF